jgi:hypothetical protein
VRVVAPPPCPQGENEDDPVAELPDDWEEDQEEHVLEEVAGLGMRSRAKVGRRKT